MRLALLGPSEHDEPALERAVVHLVDQIGVERAVYLGVDGALDRVVHRLASQRVSGDPDVAAIWQRATEHCLRAPPDDIRRFLQDERWLRALGVFASVPSASTRSIELIAGRVAVFVYDKAALDEEDILPASILAFGRSEQPVIRQIGPRWFLSPGHFPHAGAILLEDARDGLHLTLFDGQGQSLRNEILVLTSGAKVRVTGAEQRSEADAGDVPSRSSS